MMKQPTVRPAKIKRDTVKARLIIFGILAVLLILCSLFSEYLTPYDPYLQDLSNAKAAPSAQHIFGTGSLPVHISRPGTPSASART